MIAIGALLLGMLASHVSGQRQEPFHLIPGAVPMNAGPDGNSVILDAPAGLIVVDTGRHPEHSAQILAYARKRHKPIKAIINTHWHLDHTTGNWDVRKAYPHVQIYASNALHGALATYLKDSRQRNAAMLTDPRTSAAQRAELARGFAVIDHPERIGPNVVVARSGTRRIAGRTLDLRLARFAATEGDLWIYDPRSRTLIAGDLVVDIVPFMDTACPEGWRNALAELAATPFVTLIPGHGQPMNRAQFNSWRSAYGHFLDCGLSSAERSQCVDGWMRDAGQFIDGSHDRYVREAADYYLTTRLRVSAREQTRYCRPLR